MTWLVDRKTQYRPLGKKSKIYYWIYKEGINKKMPFNEMTKTSKDK